MRGRWRAAIMLWVVGNAPATTGAQVVKDSAGLRVVRYPLAARPPATWRVERKPLLTIGGGDATGPAEFAKVIGAWRLADGRVVVANRVANELRYFAQDGTHLATVGRKGQGPGEFDGMAEVHRSGDSIAVVDRTARLQVFGARGELLRAYRRPTVDESAVFGWAGLLPEGSGIVRSLETPSDTTLDHITAFISFALRPSASEQTRFLARFKFVETERMTAGVSAGTRCHTPLWLGPALRTAVVGSRFCASYSEAWSIQCVDAAGREVMRTSRDLPPAPVSAADRAAFEAAFRANFRAMPRDQLNMTLRTFRYATSRGRLGRFVGSTDGDLWVGEFAVADEVPRGDGEGPSPVAESRWSVLGADGRWRADVVLPARFALMDAGPGWVAGVLRDTDDVESVVVYRVTDRGR